MTTEATAALTQRSLPSPKEQFLEAYEREHATTVKVLRAYPTDQLELRPAPRSKTARELAWIFVMERRLGTHLMNDAFATGASGGPPPEPPESWDELLAALENAHREFGDLVRGLPDDELMGTVKFFVAPHTLGDFTRLQVLWFLLCDQIHHRGQFSVYLRIAGAKVPSIYGPTADEPWR
jgi:uncharacterized damage-inducible protein DinB